MVSLISTMEEEEIQALGMSSVVHAGQYSDDDNPVVSSSVQGIAQQDRDGRQIISFRQFLELTDLGAPLHNYALRIQWPGKNTTQTIIASKYIKWFGIGYRPLGYEELMRDYNKRKRAAALVKAKLEAEKRAADGLDSNEDIESEAPAIIAKRADDIVREKLQEIADAKDEVTVFRCRDKYPDCKRFFDSQRGLGAHWRLDHKELLQKKSGRPTKIDILE